MVNENLYNITDELTEIGQKTEHTFGQLNTDQINWKPSEAGWSIGQCFEHLIKSNELFFDEIDRIAAGTRRHSLLENWSPLSSFFGKLLISSLEKDERKLKAPTSKIVPPSAVDEKIIDKFLAHQTKLIEKIKTTGNVDWRKTIVTSPFMKLVTYKLEDGYKIIAVHEKRHFRQAERVLQAENFPK
ncbi:MAG TPA: DinB family protein [Pyrinomonadaceae bacterium]|jgi:hypothetical protein